MNAFAVATPAVCDRPSPAIRCLISRFTVPGSFF